MASMPGGCINEDGELSNTCRAEQPFSCGKDTLCGRHRRLPSPPGTTLGHALERDMHKNRSLGQVGVLLIVGLMVGCGGDNGTEPNTTPPTGNETTPTGNGPAPPQAAVSVEDNLFNPANQRVAVGGTITWTWTGAFDHGVLFSSGAASPTQTAGTFARTFATAGTFPYTCTVHGSSMSGTIVVE